MAKSRFAHLDGPVIPTEESLLKSTPEPLASSESDLGIVQLNLKVSPALRNALRMKALRLGIPLTEALRPLLQSWVDDK